MIKKEPLREMENFKMYLLLNFHLLMGNTHVGGHQVSYESSTANKKTTHIQNLQKYSTIISTIAGEIRHLRG